MDSLQTTVLEKIARLMLENNLIGFAGTFRLLNGRWLTCNIQVPPYDDGACKGIENAILKELDSDGNLETYERGEGLMRAPKNQDSEMPH